MQNPFAALGLGYTASTNEIRAAYHARVKLCHPDHIKDKSAQKQAEDTFIQLNLAYAEALRQASLRESGETVLPDAKQVARRLYEQGHYDSALRILSKAPGQDADWFDLQGSILLKKGEPKAAHASFRTAIRLDPETSRYHESALQAGVQMRKQKTLRGRMSCWARGIVGRVL